ncbi:MAG: hypothetical protein JRN06_03770 [Nitrososphaerota archaeon]|nr:hypothetical protein [Nitrososphaerota archaeon]MDG7022910.1 hypothetical protein [Nitrososphaerota archaeon]
MNIDAGILLAAAGITLLELAEASAVGLALFAESGKAIAFAYVAAGIVVVFAPTFLVAGLISLLPVDYVRIVGGVLLLYFGLRLARSARRSVVRSRTTGFPVEEFEKGLMYTGFSVGAVEAFEASVVLVGLLPENLTSASMGVAIGVAGVVLATYVLRSQVRKVKQANMKVVVSGLLLAFSTFWFGEILASLDDLLVIPLFIVFSLGVYWFANRDVPATPRARPS